MTINDIVEEKDEDEDVEPDDHANRNYKDSVFTDLFYEDEKAKEKELELYNALFNTSYTMEQVEIEKIRVDNVVYMRLKNDVSFNINNKIIVFCEHQSTVNGNMPLRDLLYIAKTYEEMVPVKERYARKKSKLPRPVFFVFYNGTDKMPAETIQKLSDSYVDSEDYSNVSLELEVKVININTEAGNKLLEKCQILREYSQFVEQVRRYRDEGYEDFMKRAITYCIENHILEEYLSRKGSDVMNFLCAEYDYEMDMQVHEEEAYEDGFAAGKEAGVQEGFISGKEAGVQAGFRNSIISFIKNRRSKGYSTDEIANELMDIYGITRDEVDELIQESAN